MSSNSDVNQLIYKYLIDQKFTAAAKAFAKESSVDVKSTSKFDLSSIVSSHIRRYSGVNSSSSSDDSSSEDEKPVAKKVAATPAKKVESSSSSSDSDSEEEKPAAKKVAAATPAKKVAATPAKKVESSSSESDSESEDEKPVAKKVAAATPAKKVAATPAKKVESSSSSSSDSESEDEKPVAKKVAAKKPSSSSSSSSSSDDSSSEDEKPVAKKVAAAAPAKKVAATPAKKVESSSSSESDSESEDEKPVAKKVAATNGKRKQESSESSDSSAESEKPVIKKNKTSESTSAPSSAGNTEECKVYVKGLPWKASEFEVKDFFKGCGKIVSCELPLDADGRSTGTAYVVFSQKSELDAALKLDEQVWPGTERWLKIVQSTGRPDKKTFTVGVRPEGCNTIFMGNLSWDVTEEQIRELFSSCGTITSVRFASAEDGSFKGFGHVQFEDEESTDAAVKLAGTDVCGRAIRCDYAPPRNRESFGAGGGGGGRGRGGGRGDSGGRGGRGGRGAATTPINKSKGAIASTGSGKKMTFDE